MKPEIKVSIAFMIILFIVTFTINNVNANLGCFKQNDPIEIRVIANCSDINLTEVTAGSSMYLINSKMTNIGGQTFNYTFYNSSNLGTYTYSWNNQCVDCSQGTCGNSFEVTKTGLCQTTSQGIGSAMFLLLMLALTFLFGYLGFKFTDSPNLWIMGLFFIFLSFLFIVYDVWLGYEYHMTFTGLSSSAMPETIFYIFLFMILAGFLTSLGLLFLRWKQVFKYFKRELRRKDDSMDEDIEDWDLSKFQQGG